MTEYYEPTVKAGGSIQSIKNLVDNLLDKLDFYIVSTNRDLGDNKPFPELITNKWLKVGNIKVFYVDPFKLSWKKLIDIINGIHYLV